MASGLSLWPGAYRTDPVLEVVGPGDLASLDGLDVDRHDPEALPGVGHPKQVTSRSPAHLAANGHPIPGDENFLDLEMEGVHAAGFTGETLLVSGGLR